MSRVKEVVDISKEIIQKLETAINTIRGSHERNLGESRQSN